MSLISAPEQIIEALDILGLERLKSFNFAVQIDGQFTGSQFVLGFESVDGLSETLDVKEVLEGGYPGRHKFPRKARQNAITLVRGMTFSRSFWNWHQEVINWTKGQPDYRRTMSIYMLDQIVKIGMAVKFEAWRWDLFQAWPSEWLGPPLKANEEKAAFEAIVIQHSGISEAEGVFSGTAGEILGVFQ